jgi:hypothetical protein
MLIAGGQTPVPGVTGTLVLPFFDFPEAELSGVS